MSAEYAGPPNAWAKPTMNEPVRKCQTFTTWKPTSAVRMRATVICTHCEKISMWRRSKRSASTPAQQRKEEDRDGLQDGVETTAAARSG